jgi:histone deacetylase 1/2
VYGLQDTDTTTEDSEGSDSWDSDESSSSQNNWRRGPYRSSSASRINGRYTQPQPHYTSSAERKRMSLITGKYYDIPFHENGFSHFDCSTSVGKAAKRRFFPDEPGKWDDGVVGVVDASVNVRMVGGNTIVDGFGHGYGYAMVPELARIMERGGLDGYGEDGEPDEGDDDDDVPMST